MCVILVIPCVPEFRLRASIIFFVMCFVAHCCQFQSHSNPGSSGTTSLASNGSVNSPRQVLRIPNSSPSGSVAAGVTFWLKSAIVIFNFKNHKPSTFLESVLIQTAAPICTASVIARGSHLAGVESSSLKIEQDVSPSFLYYHFVSMFHISRGLVSFPSHQKHSLDLIHFPTTPFHTPFARLFNVTNRQGTDLRLPPFLGSSRREREPSVRGAQCLAMLYSHRQVCTPAHCFLACFPQCCTQDRVPSFTKCVAHIRNTAPCPCPHRFHVFFFFCGNLQSVFPLHPLVFKYTCCVCSVTTMFANNTANRIVVFAVPSML